jgi:valyl-tRNA synthetase
LAAPGRDIKLAERRVEGYRNFVTKLWNAARYVEMNGCALVPGFSPKQCRLTINRWIASAASDCAAAVTAALDAYRFDEAANHLYQFVWGTYCDWYLEFTKPILQGDDATAGAETKATTAWVLDQIVHLMHPIMPFVTEEVWENLAGSDAGLLLTALWPDLPAELKDPVASAEMEWVVQAISAIRAVRAEMNVPGGSRLLLYVKDVDPVSKSRIENHKQHFLHLARLSTIEFELTDNSDIDGMIDDRIIRKGDIQITVPGATLVLRPEGIDLAREEARLVKEIGRLDADLAKLAAKLSNPGFLANAKPEVIEEQREREAAIRLDRDRAKAAYDRLAAT